MRCLYCVLFIVIYVRIRWYMFDFVARKVWYRFSVLNEGYIFIYLFVTMGVFLLYFYHIILLMFLFFLWWIFYEWYLFFFHALRYFFSNDQLVYSCIWFINVFVSNKNDEFCLTKLILFFNTFRLILWVTVKIVTK